MIDKTHEYTSVLSKLAKRYHRPVKKRDTGITSMENAVSRSCCIVWDLLLVMSYTRAGSKINTGTTLLYTVLNEIIVFPSFTPQ